MKRITQHMLEYDYTTTLTCPICGQAALIATLDTQIALFPKDPGGYWLQVSPAKAAQIAAMELDCLDCGATDNMSDPRLAAAFAPIREACTFILEEVVDEIDVPLPTHRP
jgi:hypothetical protein